MNLFGEQITKETILQMPSFVGLSLPQIVDVCDEPRLHAAEAVLMHEKVLGFDTEHKPIFVKNMPSAPPALVQFSTGQAAYLFHIEHIRLWYPLVQWILESHHIDKVGFGLSGDLRNIREHWKIQCVRIFDVGQSFKSDASITVGAVQAVARVFGQHFHKAKKTTTSNWGQFPLTEKQKVYAANDAYIALRVHQKIQESRMRSSK